MKKFGHALILVIVLLMLIVPSAAKAISIDPPPPPPPPPPPTPTPVVYEPEWSWTSADVAGELLPMWKFGTAPHAWEQLLSTGLDISAADTICLTFRKGQFGWTGKIYQQVGETWVPLATTIQWTPNEEGQKMACAKAPSAGVYALWGYWQEE
jgi:hypothetical protein